MFEISLDNERVFYYYEEKNVRLYNGKIRKGDTHYEEKISN
jgi:hypothetical protein